jgi:succinoglycan biosynthesis protein ExoO
MTIPADPPTVSVVMAFHNGAAFLGDAIASVLAQTHRDLELLLCDDGSTDGAPAIATTWQARDARIRVLRSEVPAGPGAARNRGLDAARGAWIAVVDADDLLHPDRIAGLLRAAAAQRADVVADDLVRFGAEGGTLLSPLGIDAPWLPDATALLRAEGGTPPVPVGYLKPLIRRGTLGTLRYREDLPIGEDFDLLLRLSLKGARIAVLPEPWYLYRRHARSTSHRMAPEQHAAIEAAIADLVAAHPDWAGTAAAEIDAWRRRMKRGRAFGDLVRALKQRDPGRSLVRLAKRPALARDLLAAAKESFGRRFSRRGSGRDDRPVILAAHTVGAEGRFFPAPEAGGRWDSARAAALARITGSGDCHLLAVGRPGLRALGHVPGWRLAEIVTPPGGWTAEEEARIAARTSLSGAARPVGGTAPHGTARAPRAAPSRRWRKAISHRPPATRRACRSPRNAMPPAPWPLT